LSYAPTANAKIGTNIYYNIRITSVLRAPIRG